MEFFRSIYEFVWISTMGENPHMLAAVIVWTIGSLTCVIAWKKYQRKHKTFFQRKIDAALAKGYVVRGKLVKTSLATRKRAGLRGYYGKYQYEIGGHTKWKSIAFWSRKPPEELTFYYSKPPKKHFRSKILFSEFDKYLSIPEAIVWTCCFAVPALVARGVFLLLDG